MIVLKRIDGTTGHQIVTSLDGVDMETWEATELPVPNNLEARPCTFDEEGSVPVPVRLSYEQAVARYTAAEKERVFLSDEPAVHKLIRAAQTFGVVLGSIQDQQGAALLAGLGLLDGLDRAARILAGEVPE